MSTNTGIKSFTEYLNEALNDIRGNYKKTWYEVSRHVVDDKDKNRSSRVQNTDKTFEQKIKKALKKIDKQTGNKHGDYGLLFKSNGVKCGFIARMDSGKNPSTIDQRLNPQAANYENIFLVIANLPCRDDYPSVDVNHEIYLSEWAPEVVTDNLLNEGFNSDKKLFIIELDEE